MQYGMYVSAAGALAQSYRQDVVANNLANVDTVAFKRDLALMKARPTAAQQNGQTRYSTALLEGLGGGVFALPTRTDFTPSSLEEVGDPYSLALSGKGFFQIQKGDQTYFTRDGRFTLNDQNQLVTLEGQYPVLSEKGTPIALDRQLRFYVNDSGVITQGGSTVGQIGVVDVDDPDQLRKEGNNFYILEGDSKVQSVPTSVKQGFLEQSGINPTKELVNLIKTQQMYQLNMNMLSLQDQTLSMAVTRLGSLNS